MSLEGRVNDPMVGGKSVMVREGGNESLDCTNCGTEVNFTQNEVLPVLKIACSPECATEAFPATGMKASVLQPKQPKNASTEVCSICGGLKRGRGFAHTAECTAVASRQHKNPATCPSCGGARAGRGFKHTENCLAFALMISSRVQKSRTTNVCSECGGPARGRGFAHLSTCSLLAAKVKAKAPAKVKVPTRVCPDCGGPARGRGYTHTPNCPSLTKSKVAPVTDVVA